MPLVGLHRVVMWMMPRVGRRRRDRVHHRPLPARAEEIVKHGQHRQVVVDGGRRKTGTVAGLTQPQHEVTHIHLLRPVPPNPDGSEEPPPPKQVVTIRPDRGRAAVAGRQVPEELVNALAVARNGKRAESPGQRLAGHGNDLTEGRQHKTVDVPDLTEDRRNDHDATIAKEAGPTRSTRQ